MWQQGEQAITKALSVTALPIPLLGHRNVLSRLGHRRLVPHFSSTLVGKPSHCPPIWPVDSTESLTTNTFCRQDRGLNEGLGKGIVGMLLGLYLTMKNVDFSP